VFARHLKLETGKMLVKQAPVQQASKKPLTASIACNILEVREAQRLRYRIFAEEMGARVPGREQGIDCDIYDAYCDHLLVRDAETREVVGTYRILNGAQARRIGGFYSDQEFDLTRINHLRDVTVEVGRSCVHPDYRSGATITLLWSGLGDYMLRHAYRYLIGCASISMADGGHGAAGIYERLRQSHLSPVEYRVFPRCALPLDVPECAPAAPLPPLIKGYVRVGAYVCGAPAWDPDFNSADLLMLLPLSRTDARYARHFLKAG
jgi:putative hemolysin